jgi:hypothetical protein
MLAESLTSGLSLSILSSRFFVTADADKVTLIHLFYLQCLHPPCLNHYWSAPGQKRTQIHVSDIQHCLPRTAFYRLDKNSQTPDERTMKFWIGGEIKHLQLQEILGPDFQCEKEISHTCNIGIVVVGHVDAIHKESSTVVEFKTTESPKVGHTPWTWNILQLQMYMSILGSSKGVLMYLILGSEVKNYFPEYHLTMDEDQRRFMLKKIERLAIELQAGIDARNPELVSHVADNPTYMNKSGLNWYCKIELGL